MCGSATLCICCKKALSCSRGPDLRRRGSSSAMLPPMGTGMMAPVRGIHHRLAGGLRPASRFGAGAIAAFGAHALSPGQMVSLPARRFQAVRRRWQPEAGSRRGWCLPGCRLGRSRDFGPAGGAAALTGPRRDGDRTTQARGLRPAGSSKPMTCISLPACPILLV